jgi:hypothetical protein
MTFLKYLKFPAKLIKASPPFKKFEQLSQNLKILDSQEAGKN